MRLIDAIGLCKTLNKAKIPFNADINSIIITAPTVEERKKGKWVTDQTGYYPNCSECGYQMDTHTERGYFNFCPNCGADMRGEEK